MDNQDSPLDSAPDKPVPIPMFPFEQVVWVLRRLEGN